MIGDEHEIARERAKTAYTFTTTDPEEAKLYLNAHHYRSCLWELIHSFIRNELKHGSPSKDRATALEDIRKFVMDELGEVGLE